MASHGISTNLIAPYVLNISWIWSLATLRLRRPTKMRDRIGFGASFSSIARFAESPLFGDRDLRVFADEASAVLFLFFDFPSRLFDEPLDDERLDDLLDELELDLELLELPELELFIFLVFNNVFHWYLLKLNQSMNEYLLRAAALCRFGHSWSTANKTLFVKC